MKCVLLWLGRLGLVLTIAPSFLYLFDRIDLDAMKTSMLIGTALWFACAPLLQRLRKKAESGKHQGISDQQSAKT